MAPKNCGKCGKQVYPMDELKCLDKVWHKACFKCQACGMTLNMKNYKGFEKQPYCTAHYPEIKHTQVAETPETKRIAENTKIQSQIKYHEDFEKNKGSKISVADDPETMRARKNMQTISQVVYHGELEKKLQMEESRRPDSNDVGGAPSSAGFCPPPQAFSYPAAAAAAAAGGGGIQARPQSVKVSTPVRAPPTTPTTPSRPTGKGRMVKALYDYRAADTDEVSFQEEDLIVSCDPIDDGWIIGTVERTGRRGMLPANYVSKLNW